MATQATFQINNCWSRFFHGYHQGDPFKHTSGGMSTFSPVLQISTHELLVVFTLLVTFHIAIFPSYPVKISAELSVSPTFKDT